MQHHLYLSQYGQTTLCHRVLWPAFSSPEINHAELSKTITHVESKRGTVLEKPWCYLFPLSDSGKIGKYEKTVLIPLSRYNFFLRYMDRYFSHFLLPKQTAAATLLLRSHRLLCGKRAWSACWYPWVWAGAIVSPRKCILKRETSIQKGLIYKCIPSCWQRGL